MISKGTDVVCRGGCQCRAVALAVALCCMVVGAGFAAEVQADAAEAQAHDNKRLPELPFKPGEKIYYSIRWSVFDVGTATMEFVGPVQFEGQEAWQIILTAQTNSFADKIYKVRDYNVVWVDKEFTRPLYYVKNQNEGGTHREVAVTFDWDKCKVQYSDKGVAREPIDIKPGSWDPLGITYAVRALDLGYVTHLSIPATDGKKSTTTEIAIVPAEKIRIPAGRFDTVVLVPDTKDLGGVFRKSTDAGIKIWFTDDARHIPVRMASRVAVGSFVAEMVRIEGPGADAYNNHDQGEGKVKPRGGRRSASSGSDSTTTASAVGP
jgi:hypothetical protein